MRQPDPEWVMVYTSTLPHKVSIVKAVLEDNQISSFEINKKDSAYISIGHIDLYVYKKDVVLAEFIIKSHDL
jgi:hypothetical protein